MCVSNTPSANQLSQLSKERRAKASTYAVQLDFNTRRQHAIPPTAALRVNAAPVQHKHDIAQSKNALVYPEHRRTRVGARADGAHGVPEGDVGRHVALEGCLLDVGRVGGGELLHDGLDVFYWVLHCTEIGWWRGREMRDGSRR